MKKHVGDWIKTGFLWIHVEIKTYSFTHQCVLMKPFTFLKWGITWTFIALFCSACINHVYLSPYLPCSCKKWRKTPPKCPGHENSFVWNRDNSNNLFSRRFWERIVFAFASVMAACCLCWLTISEQSRYSTSSWVGCFSDLCVLAWCFQICCTPVHYLTISSASSVTSKEEAPIVLKSRLNSSSWTLGR